MKGNLPSFLYHFSPPYAMMKITIKFKIQISEASGLSCTQSNRSSKRRHFMEISFLQIQNFKSIEHMILRDIGSALILVGKNSVGKSSILQAIAAAMGEYQPSSRTLTPGSRILKFLFLSP